MSYAWLMAPHEYEPDYDAYWHDLCSLEEHMADVGAYEDWIPELEEIYWRESEAFDPCDVPGYGEF